ncbi:hypothetical protein [Bartonella sp. MU37NMGALS]|uniref:hypothetical protein n=1 Tax=Bartonella sp. MU37NMGALS TaxID=3243560 RepID=UPI0035CFB1DD
MEFASGYEISLAQKDGFKGRDIFFNIPVKLREEIELSIRKHINVQCDNIIELHDIIALARHFDILPKISLRLCYVLANGDRSRFDMTAAELRAALSLLESNRIRLNVVPLHMGSNLNSTELIVSTLTKVGKDIYALKDQKSFISLGGGYPTSTAFCYAVTINDEYPRKIYEALSQLGYDLHKLTVIIESRRIISEDYGYLFYKRAEWYELNYNLGFGDVYSICTVSLGHKSKYVKATDTKKIL